MWKEFKEFAVKGNVMDLAVGVIIGGAFGKIVDSVVNDLIMPVIGALTGGLDFSNWFVVLKPGTQPGPYLTLVAAKAAGAVTFNIGQFLTVTVNFLLLAFVVFLLVKALNRVRRREVEAPSAPPAPTKEEALLTEIRDLLAARSSAVRHDPYRGTVRS